jgi:hypothetical protein
LFESKRRGKYLTTRYTTSTVGQIKEAMRYGNKALKRAREVFFRSAIEVNINTQSV